jgi:flagellar biosynthesis protein FliQ
MKKICTTIISLKFFGNLVFTQLAEFSHNLNRRISKMKKLLTTIVSLMFFGNLVFAQLTEFSQGDILSAGAMNQNFKYLEKRFGGLNETTVDCGTTGSGSGINAAIKNGYNSIIVKGICKENIARKAKEGKRGILKLRGFSNNKASDKIVDNSSNTESVILMGSLTFLKIDNVTISGGTRGINVVGNSFLRADDITVEKYTDTGINVGTSSAAWLGSVTVDGTQQSSSDERGIYVEDESVGWIYGTTTVNGNSSDSGGIGASNSTIWLTGTINLDSNKQSLVIQSGGNMGLYESTTTITNSTSYGIKAYHGKIWNYGTMTISNNSEGNYAVLIDWSEAYLRNMTISGGTGKSPLVQVWRGQLALDGATIKDHQGELFYAGGSNLHFRGTNSFSNKDSSDDRCVVYFEDTDFKIDGSTDDGSTTINGTNTTGCAAFNLKRSRGQIENITVTGAQEGLYAATSDVEIRGGTFSSTGQPGIKVVEGSRFKIRSNNNDISITSSGDKALDVKSSYLKLDKGSKNLTISSTASGAGDIRIRERSTVEVEDHTYGNVEVTRASYLHIDDDATVTTLICSNSAIILKEGNITDTSACSTANHISD